MANPLIATKATGVLTTQDRKDINKTINQANTNKDGVATNVSAIAAQVASFTPTPTVKEITTIVELTAAQIVGSAEGDIGHTDGAVLVAAPGAGYVLEFISAMLIYDYSGAAYTDGSNDIVINIGSSGTQLAVVKSIAKSFLLGASEDKIYLPYSEYSGGVGLPVPTGAALSIAGTAFAQPGAAAGVLRVHITYKVHTTSL